MHPAFMREALDLARKAVSANLGDAHSHNHEASVRLAAGDLEGAQASVDRALKLAPTEVTFLRRAAYLQSQVCSVQNATYGNG